MIRFLPVLVELVLLVYCLVECIQTRPEDVRNLPKWAWVVLILLFPIVGGLAWLLAGRPKRVPAGPATGAGDGWGPGHGAPSRPLAPDDDPAFLEGLRRADRDHEDVLRRWEEDLRRRERAARGEEDEEPGAAR